MEPQNNENINRWVVIGFCITVYIFFAYNLVHLYLSLLGSHTPNPLLA